MTHCSPGPSANTLWWNFGSLAFSELLCRPTPLLFTCTQPSLLNTLHKTDHIFLDLEPFTFLQRAINERYVMGCLVCRWTDASMNNIDRGRKNVNHYIFSLPESKANHFFIVGPPSIPHQTHTLRILETNLYFCLVSIRKTIWGLFFWHSSLSSLLSKEAPTLNSSKIGFSWRTGGGLIPTTGVWDQRVNPLSIASFSKQKPVRQEIQFVIIASLRIRTTTTWQDNFLPLSISGEPFGVTAIFPSAGRRSGRVATFLSCRIKFFCKEPPAVRDSWARSFISPLQNNLCIW